MIYKSKNRSKTNQ